MAVCDAHVFPGFQSNQLLFSHPSAEVRVENMPEINSASTGSQTHIHQVMSLTHSPLSNPGGTDKQKNWLCLVIFVKITTAQCMCTGLEDERTRRELIVFYT